MKKDRRGFIQSAATLATFPFKRIPSTLNNSAPPKKQIRWPLHEGPNTPKMVSGLKLNADTASMRRLTQVGIHYVSSVALPGVWQKDELLGYMKAFKQQGLTLYNLSTSLHRTSYWPGHVVMKKSIN